MHLTLHMDGGIGTVEFLLRKYDLLCILYHGWPVIGYVLYMVCSVIN